MTKEKGKRQNHTVSSIGRHVDRAAEESKSHRAVVCPEATAQGPYSEWRRAIQLPGERNSTEGFMCLGDVTRQHGHESLSQRTPKVKINLVELFKITGWIKI